MDGTFLPAVWGQHIDNFVNEPDDLNYFISILDCFGKKKKKAWLGRKSHLNRLLYVTAFVKTSVTLQEVPLRWTKSETVSFD